MNKKVINIVKHIKTGAKVPVIVKKVNDKNVIEDYYEYTKNRKGFTISMIQDRWDKCKEEVAEILKYFQVPGHIVHSELANQSNLITPIDVAIFWEEYIYAIEKKAKLKHNKLKSRTFDKKEH